MNFLVTRFTKEVDHFYRLNKKAQRLLSSIFLYNVISPMLGVFINAFLWRQSHDVVLIALYNLAVYAAVPLGFYLNGIFMKKFSSGTLYTFGLLIGGLTCTALIFLSLTTMLAVLIFGFLYGIAVGLYWANRNLLTLRTTESDNRIYFSGLESSSQTITTISIPLLIGYFIIFGIIIHRYTPVQGYQMLTIIVLLIIGWIGFIMNKFHLSLQKAPQLLLSTASMSWKKFRLYEFILGFINGASAFLPTLIVLSILGTEDKLGTIQAFAAILTAVIIYTLGKHLNIKHRIIILTASVLSSIVGAGFLGIFYSTIGIFVFFACQALTGPLNWIAVSSLNYDLIDNENKKGENHYAYVCDQEIYLNGGRVLGIVSFLFIVHFISSTFGLRF
ncbi:MAG TPA: MFS transporter, partial [Candidatus Sulfotelmatobacter sp.]|nr:MFS transporter [Candidatus Sulfotelmatobacter sp.]